MDVLYGVLSMNLHLWHRLLRLKRKKKAKQGKKQKGRMLIHGILHMCSIQDGVSIGSDSEK